MGSAPTKPLFAIASASTRALPLRSLTLILSIPDQLGREQRQHKPFLPHNLLGEHSQYEALSLLHGLLREEGLR